MMYGLLLALALQAQLEGYRLELAAPIDTWDEAVPLGAAILAGIGVGIYKDEQDAFDRVNRQSRTYEPDLKLNAQYAEWFRTFEQIYPTLKPLNAGLHGSV